MFNKKFIYGLFLLGSLNLFGFYKKDYKQDNCFYANTQGVLICNLTSNNGILWQNTNKPNCIYNNQGGTFSVEIEAIKPFNFNQIVANNTRSIFNQDEILRTNQSIFDDSIKHRQVFEELNQFDIIKEQFPELMEIKLYHQNNVSDVVQREMRVDSIVKNYMPKQLDFKEVTIFFTKLDTEAKKTIVTSLKNETAKILTDIYKCAKYIDHISGKYSAKLCFNQEESLKEICFSYKRYAQSVVELYKNKEQIIVAESLLKENSITKDSFDQLAKKNNILTINEIKSNSFKKVLVLRAKIKECFKAKNHRYLEEHRTNLVNTCKNLVETIPFAYRETVENFTESCLEEQDGLIKYLKEQISELDRVSLVCKSERDKAYNIYHEAYFWQGKNQKLDDFIDSEGNLAMAMAKCNKVNELIKKFEQINLEAKIRAKDQLNTVNETLAKNLAPIQNIDKKIDIIENNSAPQKELLKKSDIKNENISIKLDKNTTVQVSFAEIAKRAQKDSEIIAQESKELLYHPVTELELEDGFNEQMFFYDKYEQYTEERQLAAAKDLENKDTFRKQDYTIAENLEKALSEIGKDTSSFKTLIGNESQHITHKQTLETANLILENKDLSNDLRNIGLDLIATSNGYNSVGIVIKANMVNDFCNALFYGTRGVVKGIYNCNPVNFIRGNVYLAANILDLLSLQGCSILTDLPLEHFGHIPVLGESLKELQNISRDIYNNKLLKFSSKISKTYEKLDSFLKNASKYEKIELYMQATTEIMLTKRIYGALDRLFSYIPSNLNNTVEFSEEVTNIAENTCINRVRDVIEMIEGENNGVFEFAPQGALAGVETTQEIGDLVNPVSNVMEVIEITKETGNLTGPSNVVENIGTVSQETVNLVKSTNIVDGSRCTIPPTRKRIDDYFGKYYKGFTDKQATELLKESGEIVEIKDVEIIKDEPLSKFLKENGYNGGSQAKFNTKHFKHVYGIEYNIRKFRCGAIRVEKAGGHLIGKHLGLENIRIQENGSIKGTISNIEKKGNYKESPKTLFPQGSTPTEINEKIRESFSNIVEFSKPGNFQFVGITKCGFRIVSMVDKEGNLITSYIENQKKQD